MNDILTKAVWKMRIRDDYKAGLDVHASLIPTGGTAYQLYIPSGGCHNACTYCNYGFNHPVQKDSILKSVTEICNSLPQDIETLILESSGSFLDDRELPEDLQYKILEIVAKTRIYRIQIETHYKTVTKKKIDILLNLLKGHCISFEFGLESTNQSTLAIYNKDISVTELYSVIKNCYELGIETSLNIMLGAPLLTIKEQINDILVTINDILINCPENTGIVIFPLNIKDYTLIHHLYTKGRYSLISHWELIEVLERIPKNILDRVYISWWGNRVNEFHGANAIIHPKDCVNCHKKLFEFYNNFVNADNIKTKQNAIKKISKFSCNCRANYEREKNSQKVTIPIIQRLNEEIENLKKEFNL